MIADVDIIMFVVVLTTLPPMLSFVRVKWAEVGTLNEISFNCLENCDAEI